VRIEELLEWFVASQLHFANLECFERVHSDASDEGDVYSERAVDARAGEAEEDPELGRSLQRDYC
jgi:hypothetical protein